MAHRDCLSRHIRTHVLIAALLMQHTALRGVCGPQPGKEPLVDVDRAVVVAIHHQATVLTAIRALPQRHVLLVLADMARFGGMAFADDKEFFPNMQTLIGKYLHKAIETPIIIYQTVTNLSFSPFFAGLMFLFLDDHLPLGKIRSEERRV